MGYVSLQEGNGMIFWGMLNMNPNSPFPNDFHVAPVSPPRGNLQKKKKHDRQLSEPKT